VYAEIVSIGHELLMGEVVDTNSAHLARVLADLGINLYHKQTVGDNVLRLVNRSHLGLHLQGVGRAADGVRVMRMLEALYVSAQEGQVIEVSDP
jgi:nicotinamide-nucleotide amidase